MSYEITPSMPRLMFAAPQCDHCGNEVEMDDGVAWCETCHVEWGRIEDGEVSVPDTDQDNYDVPCGLVDATIVGPNFSLVYGPCILPYSHDGEHLCPMSRLFPPD